MTPVILFFSVLGMAVWLPGLTRDGQDWLGLRFLFSVFLIPLVLYTGNVIFGISLSFLTYSFVGISGLGLVVGVVRNRGSFSENWRQALHPIWVFTIILLVVALYRGGIEYLPYPGDEVASWLKIAKQIYLADAYWSDKIVYHLGAYMNGWPLMVVFPNILHGEYQDNNAVVMQFFMHIGVLGFVFDLTRWLAAKTGWNKNSAAILLSWLLVLGLLLIGASWILLPVFQLIDKPLLYVILTCFLLGLAGQFDGIGRMRVSVFLGGAMAVGYLTKVTILAFGPVLGVLWLSFIYVEIRRLKHNKIVFVFMDRNLHRKFFMMAVAMLGPFVFVYVTWSYFKIGSNCTASASALLTGSENMVSGFPLDVAKLFLFSALSYVDVFKPIVTYFSVAMIVLGVIWKKTRWFSFSIAIFVLAYSAALYISYLTCHSPYTVGELGGFQRYFRPNLRVIHFLAPILILFWILHSEKLRDWVEKNFISGKAVLIPGAAILVLLLVQVKSVDQSVEDMATRLYQSSAVRNSILQMKSQAARLLEIIKLQNLTNPTISIIAQQGFNVEVELGQYFGIKTVRSEGVYFHYTVKRPYRWNIRKDHWATNVATPQKIVDEWLKFDIVWPVETDTYILQAIKLVVNDEACLKEPEKFFLFKKNGNDFKCVPKSTQGKNQ